MHTYVNLCHVAKSTFSFRGYKNTEFVFVWLHKNYRKFYFKKKSQKLKTAVII